MKLALEILLALATVAAALFAWALMAMSARADAAMERQERLRWADDGGSQRLETRLVQKLPEKAFERALRKQVAAHRKQVKE